MPPPVHAAAIHRFCNRPLGINAMRSSLILRSVIALSALAVLTGCGLGTGPATSSTVTPIVTAKPVATGRAFGGRQAITGATVQLWGVGTSGYGSPSTPLTFTYSGNSVTATTSNGTGVGGNVTNGNNSLAAGSFTLSPGGTPLYTCPASNLVYITVVGGNSGGGGNNAQSVLMAGLGSCTTLVANAATTFIDIDELTTVATAYALARFSNSYSAIGAPSTNQTGLSNAFAAINEIVNTTTGVASGPALPAGATLPIAEINTLGDILAYCVNSTGTTTGPGDGTPCGSLFADTTPSGGSAPTDTFGAALAIALTPVNNAIFGLTSSSGPYQTALASSPNNWMIGVHYTGGGLASPTAVAVDNSGNVWVANSPASPATGSVSEFSSIGTALSTSTGYISGSISSPSGIAIDTSGNAWVSNSGNSSVTKIAPLGASASNYTGGGLNLPSSISIDGSGNIWVTNKGNNSITQLTIANWRICWGWTEPADGNCR